MRKINLNYLLVLIAVLFVSLTACNKEDDENNDNGTATKYEELTAGEITVTDRGEGTGTITWTSDKVYILNGLVFVNEGQTLTIEEGTLIKGKPGKAENASALIVARGGKIMAEGTAEKPIIFTAEADNREGTGVDKKARGLWGGLIVLGKATTNNATTDKAIEGIPTDEVRGLYGGTDDNDNSGVLKYISIRHGGTDIGEGNEINGLTLGAVGSKTVIEFIEVVSNADDGVEFFGGAAQIKNVLVAYCGDDSFDYDEGFHGKGQFWCTIQDSEGDRCGEHDGGPSDNELGTPYATPIIYNATYIGNGASKIITFRDNAGGIYANSIFAEQAKGIDIEYLQEDDDTQVEEAGDASKMKGCTYKMFQDGKLEIKNNVFQNVAGTEASDIFKIGLPKNDDDQKLYLAPADFVTALGDYFTTAKNSVANANVSETNPVPGAAITSDLASLPSGDSFFTSANYKGAFDGTNWAKGWTLSFQ